MKVLQNCICYLVQFCKNQFENSISMNIIDMENIYFIFLIIEEIMKNFVFFWEKKEEGNFIANFLNLSFII